MPEWFAMVRLDCITVKPYLTVKNLLILLGVSLVLLIGNGTELAAITLIMMFGVLYTSYPFAVSEKNGIDSLYVTLSIPRQSVVLGRYVFALAMDVCSALLAIIINFVLSAILGRHLEMQQTLSVLLSAFCIFSVVQAIQLPIYFKLGYTRAKFAAYLPLVAFPVVAVVFSDLLKDSAIMAWLPGALAWLTSNSVSAALFGLALWLVVMTLSYRISVKSYQKRDF